MDSPISSLLGEVKAPTRFATIHSSPLRATHSHALFSLACNTYLLAHGPRLTTLHPHPPSLLAPSEGGTLFGYRRAAVAAVRGRPPPKLEERGLLGFGVHIHFAKELNWECGAL